MESSKSDSGLFGSTTMLQTTPIKTWGADSIDGSTITGGNSSNIDDVEKELQDIEKMTKAVVLNQKLRTLLLKEEDKTGLEGFESKGPWSEAQALIQPSLSGYRILGKTLRKNPRLPETYGAKAPLERVVPPEVLKARGGVELPKMHGFHEVGGRTGRYEKFLRAPTNIELNERKKGYASTGFSHHETYEYAYIKVMRPLLKGNALEKRKIRIQNKHIHNRLTKCIRSTGYGTWEKKRPTFTFEIEEEKRRRPAEAALMEADQRYAKVTRKLEKMLLSWDRLPKDLAKEMEAVHSLYMEAKAKNHPGAMTSLGRMYWYGEGVTDDRELAKKLWTEASKMHWAEADLYLTIVAKEDEVTKSSSIHNHLDDQDSDNTQKTTTLTFTLERAKDLIDADRGGTSDPFAIVELVDATTGKSLPRIRKLKTKTVTRSLNPVWEEHQTWREIYEDPSKLALSILVFDADTLTCELLGGVTIPLKQGMNSEQWYALSNVEGRELLKNEVAFRKDAKGAILLRLKTELKARKVVDYKATVTKLEEEAGQGHAGAQCALAFELWQRAYDGVRHGIPASGETGSIDYQRAYNLWLSAAKAGEPVAQRMVGHICSHYGDEGQAVMWFVRAARQNDEASRAELERRFGDGKMEVRGKLYPNPSTIDQASGFLASTWSVNSG